MVRAALHRHAKSEINLKPPGHKQEFDAWRWAPMGEVLDLIVAFKRPVYEKVIAAFRHLEKQLMLHLRKEIL